MTDKSAKPGKISSKRIHSFERSSIFPGDICTSRKTHKSYFTIPCKKTVYELESHDAFREAFVTSGSCFGLACLAGGFAVSMEIKTHFSLESEWQVQLFDAEKKLKHQVFYDSEQSDTVPLFKRPLYLESSLDEMLLFVSDNEKNSIISLNADGQKLFEYSHLTDLLEPLALTVDKEQNVYVACAKSVVQVEKGGKASRIVLQVKSHEKALGVCFDTEIHLLSVIFKSGAITHIKLQME